MGYEADYWDWLRYVNITLAVFAVYRLIIHRMAGGIRRYPERDQVFWYALVGGMITAIVGAAENILQDNPGGPRVILNLVYVLFTLWGTHMKDPARFGKASR